MAKRPIKPVTKKRVRVRKTPDVQSLAKRPEGAAVKGSDPREFFGDAPAYVDKDAEGDEASDYDRDKWFAMAERRYNEKRPQLASSPVAQAWAAFNACREHAASAHSNANSDACLRCEYPCGCLLSASQTCLTLSACKVHEAGGTPH